MSRCLGRPLGWVGRISGEKGLVDAFAVAARTGRPLKVWGLIEDAAVWDDAVAAWPGVDVSHQGFVSNDVLARELGQCAALLMTPHWVEAFGNVVIEALACGVPVITYDGGGPAEIVRDGRDGFVVAPRDVDALVDAVGRIATIDRAVCRLRAVESFGLAAFGERIEQWLTSLNS